MKKVLSIVLAIVMIASMSAVAFAADLASKTATVKGVYDATTTPSHNYKVDLSWDKELTFTYKDAITETWDVDKHVWVPTAEGEWIAPADATVVFTIENHSSKKVYATADYADAEDDATLTVAFDKAALIVDEAPVNEANAEESDGTIATITATVSVAGDLAATEDEVTLGTITVTVSDVVPE